MNKEITTYMREVASNLFKHWPVKVTVEMTEEDEVLKIDMDTDKNDIFLQPNHDPLLAAQHILRLAVKKQFPEEFIRVVLDIGGFHKKQENRLKKLTQEAVNKVLASNESLHLSPMSSFERRLIHMFVADNDKIISESSGSGPDRHVVIKPSS